LQELRNGSRPEEIREAEAAVQAAQAEVDRAQKDFMRAEQLHKADDISTQQFDQARQRMLTAQAQLKQSTQRRDLVRQGPRREVVEQAASNVERAGAAVRLSQASQIEVKRREQEVTARRADLARLEAQLAQIDVQLAETVAASPVAGVVLVKAADPGEVLAAGTTVLTVGDIEHPWLRGYINERDLGRVKLGMPVKVKSDSFQNKTFDGKLTFIASQAEFTPKQIQTHEERVKLVYRVKIEIDNRNHELKSNMPVDAEIVVE
jgi:HlyD family secretion protein